MKRFLMFAADCAGLALAAGFQVQGNMSEAWDKSTLTVEAVEPGTKLWFTLPAHSGVTVTAKPDTGATVISRLNMASTIDLRVPGTYAITIARDSGEGQWVCRDAIGKPVLLGFGTAVDPKRHARVTYVADDEKETWTRNVASLGQSNVQISFSSSAT